MLYRPAHEDVIQLLASISDLQSSIYPDWGDDPEPELAFILKKLEATEILLKELLDAFPETPPGASEDDCFGPRLDVSDVHLLATIAYSIGILLNAEFTGVSYDPMSLLETKLAILSVASKLCVEWKVYILNPPRRTVQRIAPFLSDRFAGQVTLLSPDSAYLDSLLENIQASTACARRDLQRTIEFPVEKI
jgi:hypothetical protein